MAAAIDFRSAQLERRVNNYVIRFRPCVVAGLPLFVPVGISRHFAQNHWIVTVYCGHRRMVSTWADGDDGPEDSLARAYQELLNLVSDHANGRGLPGEPRRRQAHSPKTPLTATGYEAVIVARSLPPQKNPAKAILVSTRQYLMGSDNVIYEKTVNVFGVNENTFLRSPSESEMDLQVALREAITMRAYSKHLMKAGTPPSSPVAFNDIPGSFVVGDALVPTLDCEAIFNSFLAPDRRVVFKTTGAIQPWRL
jgi:hypothetical protein